MIFAIVANHSNVRANLLSIYACLTRWKSQVEESRTDVWGCRLSIAIAISLKRAHQFYSRSTTYNFVVRNIGLLCQLMFIPKCIDNITFGLPSPKSGIAQSLRSLLNKEKSVIRTRSR